MQELAKQFINIMSKRIKGSNNLPSQFQINDSVILNFFNSGTINNCKVIKVAFNENQVFYDVEVNAVGSEETLTTRLHNVRSLYVLSANDSQSKTLIQSA